MPELKLKTREIESEITELMLILGVPAHLRGYPQLRRAICRTVIDPEVVTMVTKLLYPDLGKEFKTTDRKVERAIRNAIEVSWERGQIELQKELWGYSREEDVKRPTNSEYIAVIADYIRLKFM